MKSETMLRAQSILPQDADDALLVGRVWSKAANGPCPVLYRSGSIFDLSPLAPTLSGLLEHEDLVARLRTATDLNALGTLDQFLDGSAGDLLAPADLQAVKAAGVTFADSMLERVIEEQAKGDPLRAQEIRGRLAPVLGDNLKGLVAYARQRPGQLSYGSWGMGSGGHLTMESFLKKANLEMVHAPYKGTAAVATDVQSGLLPVGWVDVSSQIGLVKAGRLVPIAVSGSSRLPQFPNVPTMGEQGYPFPTTSWYGMFAPAGTSAALVDRLNKEVVRAIATPAFRDRLTALNLPVAPALTPAQFRKVVADDTVAWQRIAQDAGVKPE